MRECAVGADLRDLWGDLVQPFCEQLVGVAQGAVLQVGHTAARSVTRGGPAVLGNPPSGDRWGQLAGVEAPAEP